MSPLAVSEELFEGSEKNQDILIMDQPLKLKSLNEYKVVYEGRSFDFGLFSTMTGVDTKNNVFQKPKGLLLINNQNKIDYMDPVVTKKFGYTDNEVLNMSWYNLLNPLTRDEIKMVHDEFVKTLPVQQCTGRELGITKNGEVFEYAHHSIYYFTLQGNKKMFSYIRSVIFL